MGREYKLMNVELTEETWDANRGRIGNQFLAKILPTICAVLNARWTTTIHLGVTDGGQIKGLIIEPFGIVS